MEMMKNKYQMDMCRGPLFRQIVVFSVPLMLSGILQLLFNAADLIDASPLMRRLPRSVRLPR